jgi:O-antigen ligase
VNGPPRNRILEMLWLLLAVTFPLFAVEFLRYYDQAALRLSLPLPMIALLLILFVGVLSIFAGDPTVAGPAHQRGRLPWVFCFMVLFFVWHLVSLMRSEDFQRGLREVAKLAMGIGSFWIVFTFFPRDRSFIDRFWKVSLWSSAVLIGFLVYYYAFVFNCPYLGNHLDAPTRTGRNMLTWYLVFTIPYAATLVIDSRHKLINSVPILVLTIAWLYAGSRGAWVSVAGGILALVFLLIRANPRKGIAISVALFSAMGLAVFAAWFVLESYFDFQELEYVQRLFSLFDPQAAPELHSVSVRIALMEKALDDFLRLPLTGIGLMNFAIESERVTHNDYLAILADMGLIGFLLFFGILAVVFVLGFRYLEGKDWLSLGTRASLIGVSISFFFINAYTNSIFWIFLALVLVWMEAQRVPQLQPAGWSAEARPS